MIEQLGRRCALVLLASMSLATLMGLMAWGPVLLSSQAHDYADSRAWLGIPGAANVWVNLAMLAVGTWGWRVTRASSWPPQLRTPWQLFQVCAVVFALLAALYHRWPGDTLLVTAHAATAGGFMMLTLGMLAERVHPRFGSSLSCGLLLLVAALWAGAMLIGHSLGNPIDMRPLLLLEIIPVLVIPAGALSLPGGATRVLDWIVVLSLYALAKVLESSDALILQTSGWVSGHTLMHLALTAAVGWMAYCAARARTALTPSGSAKVSGDLSHRETSLNTSG
ncbi:MAG: hypothetical protein ABI671_20235 [Burkholderiales bacterium]